MRKSKTDGFTAMREAKRQKAQEVMSQFTKTCENCAVSSSKAKLFDLNEGLFCLKCLPEDMSGIEAQEQHEANQSRLKEQRENPVRPKGFGGWA